MKYIALLVCILIFILLSSCSGKTTDKTTIEKYPFKEAENPEKNLGKGTMAKFYYKTDDGNIVCTEIKIADLEIKINDEKQKYTIFRDTRIETRWSYNHKYTLLVNSEEELFTWQEWKKKWTEIELKPAFPPDYKPVNPDKPEKE